MCLQLCKNIFTILNTALCSKPKDKIPVKEAKSSDTSELKKKVPQLPKEKDPVPEIIKLKKIQVKAAESEKEVMTQQSEVSRHYDMELTVHKLHDREDRKLITLDRTQRIFTAEEEITSLGYLEEAEKVQVSQEIYIKATNSTPKDKKDEVPEEASLTKKKIHRLQKENKDQESIKLKPFEKSSNQDDKQQTNKLKKVPSKPQETEKESPRSKLEVTRHPDSEPIAHARHHRDDPEMKAKAREVFSAQEEGSEQGHSEAAEIAGVEEEKNRWKSTPKASMEEEPEPDLAKKKIKKLPKDEEEEEMVKLKPIQKHVKPEATEPHKATKDSDSSKDIEARPWRTAGTVQMDEPTVRKPEFETAASTRTTRTPDAQVDQEVVTPKKLFDKSPKAGEQDDDKPPTKVKVTAVPDNEKGQVALKNLTKIPKDDKKQTTLQLPDEKELAEKPKQTKERVTEHTEQQHRDSPVSSEKEKGVKPAKSIKHPSPPGTEPPATKEQPLQKAAGETGEGIQQKLEAVTKKGLEIKKTPSLTAVKEMPKEDGLLKPVEQLNKFELKKTPSPKVDKPKPEEVESLTIDRKLSGSKVMRFPKTVSPKALTTVPRKPSAEEEKTGEAVEPRKGKVPMSKKVSPGSVKVPMSKEVSPGSVKVPMSKKVSPGSVMVPMSKEVSPGAVKVPMSKEISPGSVQLRKVPTQLEDEVFEEEYEGQPEEGEDNEEVWGWEMVPIEEGEDREEDGIVETPGMPGAKRGEKEHP